MRISRLGLLMCGAALGTASSAWAQGSSAPTAVTSPSNTQTAPQPTSDAQGSSNGTPAIAEIVVTAQKRQERVQDVPVAVTVVTSSQLDREQVTQLTDLSRTAPALEFAAPGGGSPGGGGIMRGIGTVAFSETAEPSVGIVVDGVNQFNANITDLFDVARVEVLEGPQGTLFGQSVSAGVINITTPTPDASHFSGFIHSQLSGNGFMGSDFGRQVVQGVVNIPLASDAALRIAAHEDHTNDIQKNSYLHDEDDGNDYGARARLYWSPSSYLKVNLISDYNNQTTSGGDFLTYAKVPAGSALAQDLAACGVTPSPQNSTSCGEAADTLRQTTYGVSGQVDYETLGDTFTSITSYRKRIFTNHTDIDTLPFGDPALPVPLPLDITNGLAERNSDYFTQEFRVASPARQFLEYTLGAFYSRYASIYGNPDTLQLNVGAPMPIVVPLAEVEQTHIESAAVFGQLTFHITQNFRLITGGRLTNDNVTDNIFNAAQTPSAGGGKDDVKNASWRLGAQYDVNRNLMGYVTVSRGFKGPQINDTSLPTGVTVVKPEIPQNYEAGIKSTVLHGRLGLSGDVFYEVVHDFQSQICVPNETNLGVNTGTICQPSNVPRVITKGVEANAFGQPLPGLTVNAGFIYNPASYPKGYIAEDGSNLSGEQLAYTSKTKVTLSTNYEHPLSDAMMGFIAVNAVYHSQEYLLPSADPSYLYPSYWTVGGEIGVKLRQGWKVSIFGQNLTDESVPANYYTSAYAPTLNSGPAVQQFITAASRRTVGVSLNVDF